MSTLEVACGRCEKRFRVRAEFAGRSTRCPGCSAPITIAGRDRPAPRAEPEERPRPRPRPHDEDEEPARPAGDWAPVDMAFRREQLAVGCVLAGIFLNYLVYCLLMSARPGGGEALAGLVVVVLAGPDLAAGAFGVMARMAALRAPPESQARGTAVASLLCALAGMAALVTLALAMLLGLEESGQGPLPVAAGVVGLVVSVLGAVGTFCGFVAQVGIARRSAEINRGVSQAAVATGACVVALVGIGILFTVAAEVTTPHRVSGPSPATEVFSGIAVGVLLPLALAVVLILYHRLLAAGRRALQGGPAGRYDG